MQVAANARCRKIVLRSLARPNVEKRRSLSWDAPHNAECISKKAAPPVSTITSDKLSEEEANRRARDCDRAVFVGNTTEVEDLTQGTYLLLLRKIHTFRCESAFSAWLHRLAVNIVRMRLGKKSRPIVSIEATAVPDGETTWPSIDIGAPDLSLEGSIDWINFERCIEQLPVGYRTIFVLHDIEGYEGREIAGILGRSVGVSKSQLHKARKCLRELL